jgi:hypothetical protein
MKTEKILKAGERTLGPTTVFNAKGPYTVLKSYRRIGDTTPVWGIMLPGHPTIWLADEADDTKPWHAAFCRMVVAAPGLLSALREAKSMLEDYGFEPGTRIMEVVDAAIARSEGE